MAKFLTDHSSSAVLMVLFIAQQIHMPQKLSFPNYYLKFPFLHQTAEGRVTSRSWGLSLPSILPSLPPSLSFPSSHTPLQLSLYFCFLCSTSTERVVCLCYLLSLMSHLLFCPLWFHSSFPKTSFVNITNDLVRKSKEHSVSYQLLNQSATLSFSPSFLLSPSSCFLLISQPYF